MIPKETELSFKDRFVDGLNRNWKVVLIVLGALVVVMAGFLIMDAVLRSQRADSAMLAEDIQDAYVDWSRQAPERRDPGELDSMIDRALEEFPRQFAAQRALFTRGLMALEDEQWESAAESFLAVADSWETSYLAPVSLFNAASALEEAGDVDGAINAWSRIADEYSDVSPDAPEAIFNLGRLAETAGDIPGAIERYESLAARFPQSRWTDLAKSRILVLEGRS